MRLIIDKLSALTPFQAFKICFGLYFANLWFSTFPFIDKLFRLNKISQNPSLFWDFIIRYNLTYVLVASFVLAAIGLAFNKYTRYLALWLLINWIIFFSMMPFIYSPPNGSYIGWILLWFVIYPRDYITKQEQMVWWIVLAVGFCASGFAKWFSPLWVQGEALWYIGLKPPFTELQKIPIMVNIMTYSTLILETFAIFFIFNKWGRKLVWLGFLGMHFFITLSMSVTEVGLFFLIYNLALIEIKESEIDKNINN
jgi:hypothetical protein